jgi:hypothetical protein
MAGGGASVIAVEEGAVEEGAVEEDAAEEGGVEEGAAGEAALAMPATGFAAADFRTGCFAEADGYAIAPRSTMATGSPAWGLPKIVTPPNTISTSARNPIQAMARLRGMARAPPSKSSPAIVSDMPPVNDFPGYGGVNQPA